MNAIIAFVSAAVLAYALTQSWFVVIPAAFLAGALAPYDQ